MAEEAPLQNLTPGLAAPQVASTLIDRIASNLLLCQRNITLYPRNHPRVQIALQSIQEDLRRFPLETGQPFALETDSIAAEPKDLSSRIHHDKFVLSRLLKLQLIKKINIYPDVTPEEIYQLANLLQSDKSKRVPAHEAVEIDPQNWTHIRLSLYRPEEFPEGGAAVDSSLEKQKNFYQLRDVEEMFKDLDAKDREAIREALKNQNFIQKVADLQSSLMKVLPDTASEGNEKLDLMSVIFRSAIPETEFVKSRGLTQDGVLKTLNSLVQFLEENLQALLWEIKSFPAGYNTDKMKKELQEAIRTGAGLSDQVNKFQIEKQRLSFLFKTASRTLKPSTVEARSEAPAAPDRKEPQAKPQTPARPESNRIHPEPLETSFREIHYDLKEIERAAGQINANRQFLHVVFELHFVEECRNTIEKNWPVITTAVLKAAQDRTFLDWATKEICEFIQETGNQDTKKLLFEILCHAENSRDVAWILEQVVLPIGVALIESFLKYVVENGRARAIPVLSALHRNGRDSIRKLTKPYLLHMASNPALLGNWALEDSNGLVRPDVIGSVIGQTSPEVLRDAFKLFFNQASIEQASRFLFNLPPGIEGAEAILFTAMDHGTPLIRKVAITQLCKYPSPMVVSTLIGIVRGNNLKQTPVMSEVEAALDSLLRLDGPEAASFLKNVLHRRRWFRRIYRKEIRRVLLSLQNGKKVP